MNRLIRPCLTVTSMLTQHGEVAFRPCTRPVKKQKLSLNQKNNRERNLPEAKVATYPKTKVATKKKHSQSNPKITQQKTPSIFAILNVLIPMQEMLGGL